MEPNAFPSDPEAAADRSLAMSVLYAAAGLAFRPPAAETLPKLVGPRAVQALEAAAAGADAGREVASAVRALGAFGAAEPDALYRRFVALFGHALRGAVPAYETEYGDGNLYDQPARLGDIGGFLLAFGLALDPEVHERVDHVSAECELLQFFHQKEAVALEARDEAMWRETRAARRLFLRDHLGRFAPGFAARVRRESGGGFYAAVADLLGGLVAADAGSLGVRLGPESLELRSVEDDGAPMVCGSDCEAAEAGGGACSDVSFPEAER